ncbi:MAG: ABC transporter permease [Ignavibacteriales bacterium]|nr:ABC transporter permease [Ignavibacteriales bacterium]
MHYTISIARRYLRFRKDPSKKNSLSFLTLIAIAGVMLGVAALIIALTILGGFEKEIKEKVAGFTTHIQVTSFQNRYFPEYENAAVRMRASVPAISGVSPFVAKEGMAKCGANTEGVFVKGINSQKDVSSVRRYLTEGVFDLRYDGTSIPGCVAGKKLLSKLHAGCGDTIIVFGLVGSYAEMRQPAIRPFVVCGVYESGMAEYDDVYLFIDIRAAQELYALGPVATGFDVMLHRITDAPEAAEDIMHSMGYPYYARTLYQMYRNLFTWIELQKEPTPIILGLIIIVATVNIIGTLLMLVMEKTKQIGILKSMGASTGAIRRIFLFQGLFIGVIGTVLGNFFALGVCWAQLHFQIMSLPSTIYFMSTVPILLRWENFAVVSAIAVGLCVLASYLPSALAARLDPVRCIRFNS